MSDEINVLSRSQIIIVEPTSSSVAVINAGPPMGQILVLDSGELESLIWQQTLNLFAPPDGNVDWNGQRLINLSIPIGALDAAINSNSYSGWVTETNAWTRTSNTTFTVSGDVTSYLYKGTKVTWLETATTKYGVIASSVHAAGTTTVTLMATTSYVMAASPTGFGKYAYGKPLDFPNSFLWTPADTGFSTPPTIIAPWWAVHNGICELSYGIFLTGGGVSNATTWTMTAPIAHMAARATHVAIDAIDNGVATVGRATLAASATTISLKKGADAAWTATGTKGGNFAMRYPI